MAEDNPKYKTRFEDQAKGLAVGDNNIIYNYFGYREEVKAKPVSVVDDNLPCPYRGLYHFNPNDAEYFFGRDVFVEELFQATQNRNYIPVLGASGSGKSSVVLAGLVPKLEQEGHWKFTHFRPGSDPFHALALALVPLYEPELDSTDEIIQARKLAKSLSKDQDSEDNLPLSDVFAKIQHNNPNHRILLIADQFEELYTQCSDPTVRRRFLDCLLTSFQSSNSGAPSSTILVTTMRADFLANALSYPLFGDLLKKPDVKIRSMKHSELEQVIVKPAQKLNVTFQEGLVERILNDVEDEPGNLPLLEFALTELWKKRRGKQLTHDAYEAIGQVKGALADYADDKYKKLTAEEQEQARRIFIQLVRPGEGTEDTRRRANRLELGEENWDLITRKDGLADSRLVVTSRNDNEQETVEVVHEALIQNWGQLREWMETNRDFRAWQERLRGAMVQWQEMKKDEGSMLHGAALAKAEEKLEERAEDLSNAERDFIRQSILQRNQYQKQEEERRQRELEQERKARRAAQTRTLTAIVSALLLGIGAIFANSQRLEIKKQSANSDYQQGNRLLENDETAPQGMAMLARSVRQGKHREASIRLWTLLQQRNFWIPVRSDSNSSDQAPISSSDMPVPIQKRFYSISFQGQTYAPDFIEVSADGSTVVTILDFDPIISRKAPQVRIWSTDGTPTTPWFTPSDSSIAGVRSLPSAHLSSDGRFVAIVASPWREPQFIEVWDIQSGKPLDELVTAQGKIPQYQNISFSKIQFLTNKQSPKEENEPLLLTASRKGDAAVYQVNPYRLQMLARSQHRTEVVFASVDDDQEWLISSSADGEIRVASLQIGQYVGNPILLERAATNLKRVGKSRLQITLETAEEQTFELISPLEVSRPNNATVSEQEDNCVPWDEELASKEDNFIALKHTISGKKLAWMGKRRIKVFSAEDNHKELASLEFSADLKVVCFSDSGEHIMTTNFEFVTEIWTSDFQTRLGPPINEQRLFSPGQTPDQATSILLSKAEDIVLTRTFFWNPPNVAYYWIAVWDVKTGLSLADRTRYADGGFSGPVVDSAVFDKSDEYLLLIDTEGKESKVLHIIQLHPPHKVLSWLPDLIEALGGIELDERGNSVSVENRIEQLEQLLPLLEK